MTADQITSKAKELPIAICEYRGGEVRSGQTRDKRAFTVIQHRLELAANGRQMTVTEYMPDGTDATKIVLPFKKGAAVIVDIERLEMQNGVYSVRGKMLAA